MVAFTKQGATQTISAVNEKQLIDEIFAATTQDFRFGHIGASVVMHGYLDIRDNPSSGIDIDIYTVNSNESPTWPNNPDGHIEDWVSLTVAGGDVTEIVNAITSHTAIAKMARNGVRVFSGTVDPAVTDDTNKGIRVGDFFFNTVSLDVFMCIANGVGAAQWQGVMRTFSRGWTMSDMASGSHHLAGVFEQEATAQTVDGVPTSPVISDMGRKHLMVNVTTLTTAGTLRITGTSYDEDDGSTTGSDTEDIVIDAAATGYYRSIKNWQGDVTLSSVGGLDCILDTYRYDSFGHHQLIPSSTIQSIVWHGTATSPSHSVQIQFYKFDPVARTMVIFYDVTQDSANAKTFGDSRHYVSTPPDIDFDNDEGVYVRVIVTAIQYLHFDVGFKRT